MSGPLLVMALAALSAGGCSSDGGARDAAPKDAPKSAADTVAKPAVDHEVDALTGQCLQGAPCDVAVGRGTCVVEHSTGCESAQVCQCVGGVLSCGKLFGRNGSVAKTLCADDKLPPGFSCKLEETTGCCSCVAQVWGCGAEPSCLP